MTAPDAGYYPSCVVNMTLRFDESIQVASSPDDLVHAARQSDFVARGRSISVGQITAESYDQSGGRIVRRALPGRASTLTSPAPVPLPGNPGAYRFDDRGTLISGPTVTVEADVAAQALGESLKPLTFHGDRFTTVMNVLPARGTFDLPHPRQAATFEIEIPYSSCPIDPRLLRAAGVEIHLGCVSAEAYGAGMEGAKDAKGQSTAHLSTRSGMIDPLTGRADTATLLMYGTVDKWKVKHRVGEVSTCTITGRSITGLLLDGKPPADVLKRIDLNQPIHHVLGQLIATIPDDRRLALDIFTDKAEWPGGVIPSPGSIEGFTNVRLGAADGQPKGGGGGGERLSYMDLITNLCNLVGGVAFVEGKILWVRPGRSVFEVIDARYSRRPFQTPRTAADGPLKFRRLMIGQNVTGFDLERTFGGTPVPVVQCIGHDDRATGLDRIVKGQWPPAASAAAKAKTDGEILRVPILGVRDAARLTQIARSVYEEVGRGEVGGEFETATLSSFGGSNADPDLLRLRPLEPVEIVVDQAAAGVSPVVNELAQRMAMTYEEEVYHLYQRIGDRDAAQAIVAARRGAVVGILDAFRVVGVRYEVDQRLGVKVTGTFQSYIVPRHGVDEDEPGLSTKVEAARVRSPGQDRARNITAGERNARRLMRRFARSPIGKTILEVLNPNDPRALEYMRRQRIEEDARRRGEERVINREGARSGRFV